MSVAIRCVRETNQMHLYIICMNKTLERIVTLLKLCIGRIHELRAVLIYLTVRLQLTFPLEVKLL